MAIRVGIPLPTSGDSAYNDRYWSDYARAVHDAGGEVEAIRLTGGPSDFRELTSRCDGFLLPGSPADVDPALYGQQREDATAYADPAREECDLVLLEHAAQSGKPVLAVCYGLQRLNVWLGGTLVQDILPVPVNHAAGPGVAVAHSVLVTAQSLLAGLLSAGEAPAQDGFRRLGVNSSHHQAVALAGEGLVTVARCAQDGVVEALEGRVGRATMVGVQWHPERSTGKSAASRALFTWLVSAADDWETEKSLEGGGVHLL